jgi:hypothetical protein
MFLLVSVVACTTDAADPQTNATHAPPEIVFLSPQSNYYFAMGGIDTTLHIELRRDGRYRCGSAGVLYIDWLQKGTWRQSSNGIITLDYELCGSYWDSRHEKPHEQSLGGVWHYRGHTFYIDRWGLDELTQRLEEVVESVDLAAERERRFSFGFHPQSRLAFETDTGGVNIVLGILTESGHLPIPLWGLLALNQVCRALMVIIPIAFILLPLFLRQTVPCPNCQAQLIVSAVRGYRTLRCRKCKTKTKLPVPIPLKVRFYMNLGVLLVFVWLTLLITTAMSVVPPLMLLVFIVEPVLAESVRKSLYARWLFRRLNAQADGQLPSSDTYPRESI